MVTEAALLALESGMMMTVVTSVNMNITLLLFSPRASIDLRVCHLKQRQRCYLRVANEYPLSV